MAGYMAGATTMVVDGFVGAVAVGDLFTVAGDVDGNGDLVVHQITAHAETLGNTTSITFTPPLFHAVADEAAIVMLPHQLKVRIGEGNISWTEKRPIVYVKDRGLLDTVRRGDEEPLEVKLDATWVFLTSASGEPVTIEEALKKIGAASNWISSSSDPCEPYAVNVIVIYTPPCAVEPETYTLSDFRYEDLGHDLKQGQIACTGKCNVVACVSTRG